jgi:hypothetical protein
MNISDFSVTVVPDAPLFVPPPEPLEPDELLEHPAVSSAEAPTTATAIRTREELDMLTVRGYVPARFHRGRKSLGLDAATSAIP